MWKKSSKWRPARTGTASGGGPVENTETGELAFAKAQLPYCEKIASEVAKLVGVAVPNVVLDVLENDPRTHAISSLHGKECVDMTLLRERLGNRFDSHEVQDALKRASGLLPLYALLATQDQKDDHLVVATDADGAYTVAAIDFAYSLAWQEADGGPVQPPGVPPALANNIDKNRVANTVEKIEAVSDEQFQALVGSIPDQLLNPEHKARIVTGLTGRRGKIRQAMTDRGWMP